MPNTNENLFLRDFWYLALPARKLRAGRMVPKTILGEPVLLLRGTDGRATALRDICPHRGMPLRYGSFDGRAVTCCYHGWSFDQDGRCTGVPSLLPDEAAEAARITARTYPCRELQGNIWVFIPERRRRDGEALPDPPRMPGFGDTDSAQVDCSVVYPLDADDAAYTLMDPAHTAYVHTWWWWKKSRTQLKEKAKEFEPAPLGWRMKRHAAPKSNRVYRLFGNDVSTEISYRLPGMRIESIEGERHRAVSLLLITPLNESETEVHQCLWWTLGGLDPLRPVFRRLVHGFLDQDRKAALLQREGLAHDPALMLLGGVDTQAKWFFSLKKEWQQAALQGRAPQNPIQPTTLRWRS
jgi:phenylpropionate dioxygenase-like ring-hydroxylating dioxygenase large terminal subunit